MLYFLEILKKKKGIVLLVVGIFLGLFLLLTDTQSSKQALSQEDVGISTDEYVCTLEEKTEELINRINGVTDARVMITLKNSGEQVFALDGSESNQKHVIIDDSLVCVNEYMPEIEGVAVVCNGGDNALVRQKITELLCSLLGIYSTHIYITE